MRNSQDSGVLSCNLQHRCFVLCNLKDNFLLYNMQDTGFLFCSLQDKGLLS